MHRTVGTPDYSVLFDSTYLKVFVNVFTIVLRVLLVYPVLTYSYIDVKHFKRC